MHVASHEFAHSVAWQVMAADGHTYERAQIEAWLQRSNRCCGLAARTHGLALTMGPGAGRCLPQPRFCLALLCRLLSPLTGQPLRDAGLAPNHALRSAIAQWRVSQTACNA